MKKIHIQNTQGQNACSKEFKNNKHNTIDIANNFRYQDKKKFCLKCAQAIGKPYFNDDDMLYMRQKKKIHIKNTKGQNVCSKEFRKNNYNEIIGPDLYTIDKRLVCRKCAFAIGKPYFDDEEMLELGIYLG